MKTTLAILFALCIAAAEEGSLVVSWDGPNLTIIRREPGCLWLVGGGLLDRRLDVGCSTVPVMLPVGGVDHLEAPLGRTVELREPVTGKRISAVPVPARYRVILPVVVHPRPVDGSKTHPAKVRALTG